MSHTEGRISFGSLSGRSDTGTESGDSLGRWSDSPLFLGISPQQQQTPKQSSSATSLSLSPHSLQQQQQQQNDVFGLWTQASPSPSSLSLSFTIPSPTGSSTSSSPFTGDPMDYDSVASAFKDFTKSRTGSGRTNDHWGSFSSPLLASTEFQQQPRLSFRLPGDTDDNESEGSDTKRPIDDDWRSGFGSLRSNQMDDSMAILKRQQEQIKRQQEQIDYQRQLLLEQQRQIDSLRKQQQQQPQQKQSPLIGGLWDPLQQDSTPKLSSGPGDERDIGSSSFASDGSSFKYIDDGLSPAAVLPGSSIRSPLFSSTDSSLKTPTPLGFSSFGRWQSSFSPDGGDTPEPERQHSGWPANDDQQSPLRFGEQQPRRSSSREGTQVNGSGIGMDGVVSVRQQFQFQSAQSSSLSGSDDEPVVPELPLTHSDGNSIVWKVDNDFVPSYMPKGIATGDLSLISASKQQRQPSPTDPSMSKPLRKVSLEQTPQSATELFGLFGGSTSSVGSTGTSILLNTPPQTPGMLQSPIAGSDVSQLLKSPKSFDSSKKVPIVSPSTSRISSTAPATSDPSPRVSDKFIPQPVQQSKRRPSPATDDSAETEAQQDKAIAASRQRVKQILQRLRKENCSDLQQLIAFFKQPSTSRSVCSTEKWIVCLELAELARREGMNEAARQLYHEVLSQKPKKSHGWIEYSKMEEECGELDHARRIAKQGLKQCPHSEALLMRALKLEERVGTMAGVHSLLSRLKDQPLERTWRAVLEGAQIEARAGNVAAARQVYHYLMRYMPSAGQVFVEAARFEERCDADDDAVAVIERGLQSNPKYGPLWFEALRVYERAAPERVGATLQAASERLLKDLRWRVFYEAAQVCERAGHYDDARAAYRVAAECVPSGLEWRVWHGAGRTELVAGEPDAARDAVQRALATVPAKMAPVMLLEQARLEEYVGDIPHARALLQEAATSKARHEWKIFLEAVLLELRAGDIPRAEARSRESLLAHGSTGRLWAVAVQIRNGRDPEAQWALYKQAIEHAPRSGEVWCEGARLHMQRGEYMEARECLARAAQFTPQYGDTFIEQLRVELLSTGTFAPVSALEQQCADAEPNYGPLWLLCRHSTLDTPRQVLRQARRMLYNAIVLHPDGEDARMLQDINRLYGACATLPRGNRRLKLVFGSDRI